MARQPKVVCQPPPPIPSAPFRVYPGGQEIRRGPWAGVALKAGELALHQHRTPDTAGTQRHQAPHTKSQGSYEEEGAESVSACCWGVRSPRSGPSQMCC